MISITRHLIKSKCLAPWIKFIWHFETESAETLQKLLPTDCIDLVLNLSNDIRYKTESCDIIAPSFHINGLRDKYSYIHQRGTSCVFGISFYSYGLFPFVNRSLSGIQNEIVDLYTFAFPLAQKLKIAISGDIVDDVILNIEKALCSELQVKNDNIYKRNLICDFIEPSDDMTIKHFCQKNGINIKTFERMVLQYTGYMPKKLRQIKRFQVASNQLVHQNPMNLSEIAYDNSFTDQSHFIKEFQRFSGKSPCTFQQEKITVKENAKYNYL